VQEELRYQLALTRIPQIGHVLARTLLEKFGSAKAIFQAKRSHLEHTEGMGTMRTRQIKQFRDFGKIDKEIRFLDKYSIRTFCITDQEYPSRLLHCYDPPTVLFCKGKTDLNAAKIVAVVGTRNHSEYGKSMTEALIRSLKDLDVIIVSGMALGIDACAHKAALQQQLSTIGVMAHGLSYMYPSAHKKLASDILASSGALITEYWSDQPPDKHLFPARNRIVAGLCDAVVVIESGIKGGSMVTADLAIGYHKDLFVIPGRCTDAKSEGCNLLIKTNRAQLLCTPDDLSDQLGWKQKTITKQRIQSTIPFGLNEEEKTLIGQLSLQKSCHIDQLSYACKIPVHKLSWLLLELEMRGLITSLPGKMYAVTEF